MSITDILNASAIKKENEKLQALINEMGAGDAVTVKKKIEEYQQVLSKLVAEKESLDGKIVSLNAYSGHVVH